MVIDFLILNVEDHLRTYYLKQIKCHDTFIVIYPNNLSPIHGKYIITLESHPLVKVTNNLIHLAIFSSSWELMQYNSLKHHNNPIATKL